MKEAVPGGRHGVLRCAAHCRPQHTVIADHSLSASHMETTMKLLKTRVQSRLALHKQFASLGKLVLGLWLKGHLDNTETKMAYPSLRFLRS